MKDSHDPTKTNSDICSCEPLGFKGRSNQKAYNHNDTFRWVTLKYVPALASALSLAHTLSLAEMLRLAGGHSCYLIGSDNCTRFLQLAGDPSAIRQMKSRRRALQNLVSWKGRPLSIVSEWKLNHKGPLHSGQIFQLAVKSYLRLTECDGRKWYVGTIVETAALFLQSCLHDAKVVINRGKPALRNIKLLAGSEGSDFLI